MGPELTRHRDSWKGTDITLAVQEIHLDTLSDDEISRWRRNNASLRVLGLETLIRAVKVAIILT